MIQCLTVTTVHCFGTVLDVATFDKLFRTPTLATELTSKFRICLLWFWQCDTFWPLQQFGGCLLSHISHLSRRGVWNASTNMFYFEDWSLNYQILSFYLSCFRHVTCCLLMLLQTNFKDQEKSEIFFLCDASRLTKDLWFLGSSQGSPICHSAMSNMWMNMSMEQWCNDADIGRPRSLGKYIGFYMYHFF